MIKNTFYCGLGKKNKANIVEIKLGSEVKDNSNIYHFSVDVVCTDKVNLKK